VTPEAATIKNGYGSLPLHVIAQRNTKMNAETKERLIRKLLEACPGAIIQQGGVGLRTPLHIIFTGKYGALHVDQTDFLLRTSHDAIDIPSNRLRFAKTYRRNDPTGSSSLFHAG
jgi:hypothetical protein